MDEILMQLGQIGRLKTKKTSLDDKREKKTDEEIKAQKAIEAYEATKKLYTDQKNKQKHLEFIKRLEADPEPNTKPLGKSRNRKGHGERGE